jgi:hypothetical protein
MSAATGAAVPAPLRAPFARAGLTGAAVWAVGALFLSVVPSYAAPSGRRLRRSCSPGRC